MSAQAGDPNLPTGSSHATNTFSKVFEQDAVLVAVDIERHEYQPHPITEIGVATLDTRDLHNVSPGKYGEHWFSKIKSRHFRIEEHWRLRNRKFVAGYPDKFLFARSEWISNDSAAQILTDCYTIPDLRPTAHGQHRNGYRDIIEIGHDLRADHRYMAQMGLSSSMPNVVASYDTQTLACKRSLEVLLLAMGLPFDYLHNAGNDATMTPQLFIAMKLIPNDQFGVFFLRAQEREPGPVIQAKSWAKEIKQDQRPPYRGVNFQGHGTVTVAKRQIATARPAATSAPPKFDLEVDFPSLGATMGAKKKR